MGLIVQQKALQAAGGLRQVLPVVRKLDKSLFEDTALDEVCAMSWRLSGR